MLCVEYIFGKRNNSSAVISLKLSRVFIHPNVILRVSKSIHAKEFYQIYEFEMNYKIDAPITGRRNMALS